MNIDIEWQDPIKLTKSKIVILDPESIPCDISDGPGVYYFSRKYGDKFSPFYIGETQNIRARLRQHLKSTDIYHVLEGRSLAAAQIGQGTRYFHYGIINAKPKQDVKKCIQIVERLMIRQAVDSGFVILNNHFTKIKTDTINFNGKKQGRGWYEKTYNPEVSKY